MLPAVEYLLSFCCVTPLYCNNSIQQIKQVALQNITSNYSNNQTASFLAVTCIRHCERSEAICELNNQRYK